MNAANEMFATRARIIDMLNSNVNAKRVNKQIARYFRKTNDSFSTSKHDSKLFDVAGTSIMNNEVKKLRFANNLKKRINKLVNSNHTEIKLVDLNSLYTKRECAIMLINNSMFQDSESQNMILDYLRK